MQPRFATMISLLLTLLLTPTAAPPPALADPPPAVPARSIRLPTPDLPTARSGVRLIPLRSVAQALGAAVTWDSATSTVTIRRGDLLVTLAPWSSVATVSGKETRLVSRTESIGGQLFVPEDFLTYVLGAYKHDDGATLLVILDGQPPEPSPFASAALDEAIRRQIGKPAGPLTPADLRQVTTLAVPQRAIRSLAGIESLPNLTSLDLSDNQLTDLSPLASLTRLTELRLAHNHLTDLSPLQRLTHLTVLDLHGNPLASLTPLLGTPNESTLVNLRTLHLDEDQLPFAPEVLAQWLPQLTDLTLHPEDERYGTLTTPEPAAAPSLRLETPTALFTADAGATMAQLLDASSRFRAEASAALRGLDALRTTREKASVHIVTDPAHWAATTGGPTDTTVWSDRANRRLLLAIWPAATGTRPADDAAPKAAYRDWFLALNGIAVSATEQTPGLPLRVESPHAVFLGDEAMSLDVMLQYAAAFEPDVATSFSPLLAVEAAFGSLPANARPTIVLYGAPAGWNGATNSKPDGYVFYNPADHRIAVAWWRYAASSYSSVPGMSDAYLRWWAQDLLHFALSSHETTPALPYRLQTANAVFYADAGMTELQLLQYGLLFENRILPGVQQDTGLRPGPTRIPISLYATRTAWEARFGSGARPSGLYLPDANATAVSTWQAPEKLWLSLLTSGYVRWLVRTAGQADLPSWFDEALAQNVAYRITNREESFQTIFDADNWTLILYPPPGTSNQVPNLLLDPLRSPYSNTAFTTLIRTHGGRPALHRLFTLTAAGTPFADAFSDAFGLTQDAFQVEYLNQVNGHRPVWARP